jgi:dipeptidyl aminopeptidase/acylaminoacyl peptidase
LLSCAFAVVALADPVSFTDLARHLQYKMVKISPDGTHIAATAVQPNGQIVLSLFDLVAKKRVDLTGRNGDDILGFWWVSSDYLVYGVAEHEGDWTIPLPTGGLYGVRADGQVSKILYSPMFGQGFADFLSPIDGKPNEFLVRVADWGSGGFSTVYRMDVSGGRDARVARAPIRDAHYLADHHGHVRFAVGDDPDGKHLVYMRAAEGGDWELLQEASEDRDWPITFSADDKVVWFACPGTPGLGICRFDPATRRMTHVWSNPNVEASGLAQGLAEDSVIGIEFSDGRPSLAPLAGDLPGVKVLIALMRQFPGEDVRFVSGTRDGSRAIVLVEADADPGTFFIYDRDSSSLSPLFRRAGWIDPGQLGRAVPFTFTTRDGLSEHGYITYPPGREGAKNLPMVVFVHGGPYGERDWWEYDPSVKPYVQAMATRGYAVLQVNFRGSGGYGFGFVKAGWHEWGGKMQDDVTDATNWAIAQGIADKNRICIYGGSYGGYAALEGAVKEPDLYKCAIGYVGVYDLALMYTRGDIPQSIYGKEYLKRALGTDMGELARRSPVHQLDRLKAKVMLIVGGRDRRVPPIQGENLHEALKARHIAHEWLYKSNEGHGFYDEKNIAELFGKVDAFLSANIGPGSQRGAVATQ